jgi:DNA polymerase elongation subunit (family B)
MIDMHVPIKEVFQRGLDLAQEITYGTKEQILEDGTVIPASPPLFPPPLKIEFEKAMKMCCIKKKKYAALLIGKEGYRYKAISYVLFNWIHETYDLMIRLEIAEFLVSQEESINKYLLPVIEAIKIEGFCKTKNLDGILIHIALTRLRLEFPEKYIAVKSNIKGEKYILVNEYRK